MGNYTTNPLRTGQETEKATGLDTLGGEFGLCWNDTVPLTTGAHNAFLSAFFEAGGVFDHLVDTCPLRLTSNNAPTNRETLGYNPQKPGRPSHCYHAFCIAKLRLVLGVVVHAGNETAGVYSAEMLDRFLRWLSGRLRPKLVRGGDGSHKEALTTRRRLQGCVARISRHERRNSITVYTAGKEDAASAFAEIAGFLHKVTAASQLRVEQRWQLIIYWAFRKYRLIYRLYPPLLGDQIMLPLA